MLNLIETTENRFVIDLDTLTSRHLEELYEFPVKFLFKDGKVIESWVGRVDGYDKASSAHTHDLHGTCFWFRLYVSSSGEIYGEMKSQEKRAIVWMRSNWTTYYYDRYGQWEYVDVFDKKGDDLPDSIAICFDCKHEFRVSTEFVNGLCSACNSYKEGSKIVPDLANITNLDR